MSAYSVVLRDADEIEKFFLDLTGMKPGYSQLSTGPADLHIRVAELVGVSLTWSRSRGRVRWQDEMIGDGLHIGFVVECAGPVSSGGRNISADAAQLWMPGKEMDVVLAGPYVSLDIGVDAQLVEQLGWHVAGSPLNQVPRKLLVRLINTCRQATDTVARIPAQQVSSRKLDIEERRDQVLESLEPVLRPWIHEDDLTGLPVDSGAPHYTVVRRADDIMASIGYEAPLEVELLAESIGVPRRTIFHAYRKLLGVGPRQYFELKRLHQLRSRLRRLSKTETTVTKIAADLGYTDLGRLASRYKLQFGELPSDTLKRRYRG